MNRQQRRALARELSKRPPEMVSPLTTLSPAEVSNGLSIRDAYDRGAKQALRAYTTTGQTLFYASAAIALHKLFGFGRERIYRVMDEMYNVMATALTSEEMLEMCERETGIKLEPADGGYTPY